MVCSVPSSNFTCQAQRLKSNVFAGKVPHSNAIAAISIICFSIVPSPLSDSSKVQRHHFSTFPIVNIRTFIKNRQYENGERTPLQAGNLFAVRRHFFPAPPPSPSVPAQSLFEHRRCSRSIPAKCRGNVGDVHAPFRRCSKQHRRNVYKEKLSLL